MLSSGQRRGAVEWCIYHGFKWCLRLTKVLIIQSEEELPGHYLPENNNVNTRLLGLSRCIPSELVSCSTIHSISNRLPCPRIHSPGRRHPQHFNFSLCYHLASHRLSPGPIPTTTTTITTTLCKPSSSPCSLPPVPARLRGPLHPSTPTWS